MLTRETGEEPVAPERLGEGLWRVPVRTMTLPPATRTNMYLVRGERGWFVVDPGSADAAENGRAFEVFRSVLRAEGGEVRGLILTHHHPDHVTGTGWWASRLGGVEVVAHPRTPVLLRGRAEWLGQVDWRLTAEDELDGIGLVETPGHASDHLAVVTREGDVLAGDLVAGIGSILVGPPDGDMVAYMTSLRKLMAVAGAVHPSHGPGSLAGRERLEAVLAHRQLREARVLEALGGEGPLTVEVLVGLAWDDVPLMARVLARKSAEAHLEKLRREGRAWRGGDGRWRGSGG